MTIGLAILTLGADWLVKSASALALAMKISPLVVGLTVVAYGTGAPELAISLQALLQGQSDITVGNVIGSNLFNILATLGLAAVITPLVVHVQLIRLEVPLLIFCSGLFWFFARNGSIDFAEGSLFVFGLVVYSIWVVLKSRRESARARREFEEEFGEELQGGGAPWWQQLLWLIAGLVLLVGGSQLFLDHAVGVAQIFGLSPLVIGLTLVAGGTSLPELATTVLAAFRGERDIAVGNAVGSSLFNILGVLGISAMVAPAGIPVSQDALDFDLPILFAVAVACLPIFFIQPRLARWQGAVFLAYYIAYTTYLVLEAVHSELVKTFEVAMLYFFMPLTVMAIGVGLTRRVLYVWKNRHENTHSSD